MAMIDGLRGPRVIQCARQHKMQAGFDHDPGLQAAIRHGILHRIRGSAQKPNEEVPLLKQSQSRRETVESLIIDLRHDDAQERWEAAEALGYMTAPPAVDALVHALLDPHPFVRWHAGRALGCVASQLRRRRTGMPLLRAFQSEIQIPSLVERLTPLAEDPLEHVRAATADALGELRLASGLLLLLGLLDDEDDSVRASAAGALGKLRSEKATGALIMLLNDDSAWVRRAAIEALGAIGGADASRALIEELRASEPMVRAGAAAALGHCQESGVTKVLVDALDDEDPQVRWHAAYALRLVGNITAVPYLEQLKEDDEWVFGIPVKDVAQEATRLIKRRHRGLWNTMRRLIHSIKVAIRRRL